MGFYLEGDGKDGFPRKMDQFNYAMQKSTVSHYVIINGVVLGCIILQEVSDKETLNPLTCSFCVQMDSHH